MAGQGEQVRLNYTDSVPLDPLDPLDSERESVSLVAVPRANTAGCGKVCG